MKTVHPDNIKDTVQIGKKWEVLILKDSPQAIIVDLWSKNQEYPNQYRIQLIHNVPFMEEEDSKQVPKHIQREAAIQIRSHM